MNKKLVCFCFDLAFLPQFLGKSFFFNYNDFHFPPYEISSVQRSSAISHLSIAPHPVRDELRLSLESHATGMVTLRILDLQGRVLQLITDHKIQEQYQKNIRIGHLAQGAYLLEISLGSLRVTEVVVKY